MVYKFEVQVAAAQDKGSRVDMEGTETHDNTSEKLWCQKSRQDWLEQYVDMCRHTCDQAGCTAGQQQVMQVLLSAVFQSNALEMQKRI